ncbi:MAG: hypothetical protein Q8926_12700, partial [Bacteroidota bacterium]|nr:hypothetical protein [Bacteroidota bacterium]
GKYIMNFSELHHGTLYGKDRQNIFFASSDDLVHWTKLKKRFAPDSNFYRMNKGDDSRWDCIYSISKAAGGFYGYWTANPKRFSPGFGFGETNDGIDWKALPPPVISWGNREKMASIEVGAVAKINEKYYMMAGSYKDDDIGMSTLESDSPQGPFYPAEKNFKLLTSHQNFLFTYFARFFPYRGEVLVDHQTLSRGVTYFGLLKKAFVDKAGILRLAYWTGNEQLKGEKKKFQNIAVNKSALVSFLPETLDIDHGVILEGYFPSLEKNEKSALYIGCEKDKGTAIFLEANGQVEFRDKVENSEKFNVIDTINREMKFSSRGHFKLFLKQTLVEFYIDDILIQCYTLPSRATGKIGILSEFKRISNLTGWAVKNKKRLN